MGDFNGQLISFYYFIKMIRFLFRQFMAVNNTTRYAVVRNVVTIDNVFPHDGNSWGVRHATQNTHYC